MTIADNPDRNRAVSVESSSAILTGTRCTTFVKLPVALSGGSSANCEPLAGAISSTRPRIRSPGYTSMRTSTGSPTLMFVSCVSRKFACTQVTCNEGEDLRAGRHQLPRADLPLADGTVGRREDARVAEADLHHGERGFFRVEISDELQFLGLENRLGAVLGLDGELVAPERGTRLRHIRFATGELRSEPLGIGDCRLHPLSGGRAGGDQRFLAAAFRIRARHVGLHGLLAGLCGGDLRLRLIDAGARAFDARVLEVALATVIFERCLRRLDRSRGLCHLRTKIVVRQHHQLVAFADALVIVHLHFTNESHHLRA